MNKIFKHKRGASGLKVVCEFAKSHCSSTEKSAINAGDYVASDLKTDKTKYFISGLKTLSIATIFAVAISSIAPVKAIADVSDDYNTVYYGLRWGLNKEGLFLSSEKTKNHYWNGSAWNLNGRGEKATMFNGYIASGTQSTVVGYGARGTHNQSTAIGSNTGSYGAQGTAIGNDAYATALGAVAIGNDDMHGNKQDTSTNGKKNLNVSTTYDNHPLTEEELKNENLQQALYNVFCSKGGSADTKGQCKQDEERLASFGLKYDETTKKYVLDTSTKEKKENAGQYSLLLAGGQGSISIGSRSISVGEGSTALGVLAKAYGDQSTALGTLSKAMGKNSFALGANSTATQENSMAFGVNSSATMKNSIAIGYGSKTDYKYSDKEAYMPGNGYAMPMAKSVGVVSVGSDGQPRRIVNLAAGAADTDAVNVSQLKALADNIGVDNINTGTDTTLRYLSVNKDGAESKKVQDDILKQSKFKEYVQLRKFKDIMEVRIKQSGNDDLYGNKKVELENKIKEIEAKYSDFKNTVTSEAGISTINKDTNEETIKKTIANIEKYSETYKDRFKVDLAHNADNKGATGADALAFGYDAKASAAGGIALGAKSEAKIGKEQFGLDFSKNSGGVTSTKTDKAWKSTDGAVSVGSDSVSRQITNLAAGTNDTDAVNVAQLKSLGTYVAQGFKVKGKGNGGTDLENDIKFGSTLEFASSNDYLKVTHTVTNGNSKFTFDIDKDKLKKELGNVGGGTGGATASNLKFKGDIGEFTAQNEVNIKGGLIEKAKLSENNIGVEANNGNTLNVKLAKELKNLTSAEFKNGTSGTTKVDGDGITYTPNGNAADDKKVSLGKDGISAGGKTIQNVGDAIKDTDAVNKKYVDDVDKKATNIGKDLEQAKGKLEGIDKEVKKNTDKVDQLTEDIQKGKNVFFNAEADKNDAKKVENAKTIKFAGDGNIETSISQENGKTTVKFALNETDLKIGKAGNNGKDGKITVAGKDNSVTIEGKDGSIGLTKDGTNATITLNKDGKPDVEGANGTKMPRLTYETQGANGGNKTIREIATLDDGLKFAGNTGEANVKLNQKFEIKGGESNTNWERDFDQGKNIMTKVEGSKTTIGLSKNLSGLSSLTFEGKTKEGTTKIVRIDDEGIRFRTQQKGSNKSEPGVSINHNGINMNDQKITNLADGTDSKDAVTKGQVEKMIADKIANGSGNQGGGNANANIKFKGDNGDTSAKNGTITLAGGQTDPSKLSDKANIGITKGEDGEMKFKLSKNIEIDSVTTGATKISDGSITGLKNPLDKNGDLSKKLEDIEKDASKTQAQKAAAKKEAIKDAISKADKSSVATIGDIDNVTKGIESNIKNINNNITNITNITNVIGDKEELEKINNASRDPNKAGENPLKTYNPYNQTVANNKNIVEAIKNINERGIKFMHVGAQDKVGDKDPTVASDDSQANYKGSIGIGMQAKADAGNAIAMGTKSVAQGQSAIAMGTGTEATKQNSIAIGTGSQAHGENSISIGHGNIVEGKGSGAIGDPTHITGDYSYSIGNNNKIASDNSFIIGNNIETKKGVDEAVALGNKAQISTKGGVALGAHSNANTAAIKDKTSVAYGSNQAVQNTIKGEMGAVSVGNNQETRQITNVAAGKEDTDAVNVAQLKAAVENINGATTTGVAMSNKIKGGAAYDKSKHAPSVGKTTNSVAIGANSVANRDNVVSVGSAGNERIISNVADGVAPTDAANMRQLQSVANMVGEVKKDAMAGTASAMAIGNLPQATIPGKGMMAVGVGFYKGEQATALGVSKMSENGRWVFKASASYDSQRNVGAAGAIGFHF